MIIIVENKNRKRTIVKSTAVFTLIAMFYLYYHHMSNKFAEQNNLLISKLEKKDSTEKKLSDKSIKLENLIYKEAVTIVKLLGQEHIQSIQIKNEKLLIVCDYGIDIEPIMIRYGIGAMVKHSQEDIKLALNLATIVENKYEA